LQKQENVFVGSLRSIPQVNIIESLEKCSELLEKFGGHSQAAGISLKHEKANEFYEKLSKILKISKKLPCTNKTKRRSCYQSYYSSETIKKVEFYWKEDLELFGYKFDSTKMFI
jgi:single-stranded DNA-specific DHH superfamily exonuclease